MDDFSALFEEITASSIIITPNRRLAATLHQQYQQFQLKKSRVCWLTPDILPLNTWLQRLYEELLGTCFIQLPQLLTTAQEKYCWEQIILHSDQSQQLLQIAETADQAQSAYQLLKQWQLTYHDETFTTSLDSIILQTWLSCFENQCQEKRWLSQADLPDFLIAFIQSKQLIIPSAITLYGFTEQSPQLKAFLTTCTQAGSQVKTFSLQRASSVAHQVACENTDIEIKTLAYWAKNTWKQNQHASIGCVIPALDKIRDRVAQIFSETFNDTNTYTLQLPDQPFNISAGKSLSRYPVIQAALNLLSISPKKLTLKQLNFLSTTPFFLEAESERIKRAYYDALLRKENISQLSFEMLLQKNDDRKSLSLFYHCPLLAQALQQFLDKINACPEKTSHSEWAIKFNDLLTLLGWPGERSLNSEEYQTVEQWFNLLREFSRLDFIYQSVSFTQALHTLMKMARDTVFQPQSPETRIQVLGVLEAAAMPFDYLWVAGMDDCAWPPQPKPHPFIPKFLQRQWQMPHATAERELTFCQTLTAQFKQSAQYIIFSYAEKNDEMELQASALIRDLPLLTRAQLNLNEDISLFEKIAASSMLTTIQDEVAPAILENEKIQGGMSLLKHQAMCPFKAFAEWRLHARELETPLPGLRAKDRGSVLHKALEKIWQHLQNQETLLSTPEEILHALIDHAVLQAMILAPPAHQHQPRYLDLEKKRLHQLIYAWLQIEKERSPFIVVSNEIKQQITLNKLTLNVRIDRIDELENKQRIIIDYKTGEATIQSWFGDRPDEPQLPLYALIDPQTAAISFAQISTAATHFKGISQHELAIKGIKPLNDIKQVSATSWEEQTLQWSQTLNKLSDDFYTGIAHIDPKEGQKTCQWCQLKPLCRINEGSSSYE